MEVTDIAAWNRFMLNFLRENATSPAMFRDMKEEDFSLFMLHQFSPLTWKFGDMATPRNPVVDYHVSKDETIAVLAQEVARKEAVINSLNAELAQHKARLEQILSLNAELAQQKERLEQILSEGEKTERRAIEMENELKNLRTIARDQRIQRNQPEIDVIRPESIREEFENSIREEMRGEETVRRAIGTENESNILKPIVRDEKIQPVIEEIRGEKTVRRAIGTENESKTLRPFARDQRIQPMLDNEEVEGEQREGRMMELETEFNHSRSITQDSQMEIGNHKEPNALAPSRKKASKRRQNIGTWGTRKSQIRKKSTEKKEERKYPMNAVLKHKFEKGKILFLIDWVGYKRNTWISPANFHDTDLLHSYCEKHRIVLNQIELNQTELH